MHPSINYTTPVNTLIDQRLAETSPLRRKITRLAMMYAGNTDLAEDLASEAMFGIFKKAQRNPSFLHESDAYITQFAKWQMLNALRPQKPTVSLDDDDLAETVGCCDDDVANDPLSCLDGLTDEHYRLIQAILLAGEDMLKANGTLNVSKVADKIGRPERTINRRIHEIQARGRGRRGVQ